MKEYLKWVRLHSRLPTKGENPDLYDWIKFQKLNFRSLSFEQVKKLLIVILGIAKMKYIKQIHAPFMQPIAAHRIKHTTCCGRAIKCISF